MPARAVRERPPEGADDERHQGVDGAEEAYETARKVEAVVVDGEVGEEGAEGSVEEEEGEADLVEGFLLGEGV